MTANEIVSLSVGPGYAAWAAGYDAQDNPMIAAVERSLDAGPLPFATARVLDIGCGTGRVLARALQAGASVVTGIDGSPEMLAHATNRLQKASKDGRARLIHAPLGEPWPTPEASFDVAVCTLVLEHVEEIAPILTQAAAALKPGGLLFLAEIHPDLLRIGFQGHFHRDGIVYSLPSYPHTAAEIEATLREVGFTAIEIEVTVVDAEVIAAIPKFRKYPGASVLLAVRALRCERR